MIKADNDKDIYLVFEYMGKLIKHVQISNFHRKALAVRFLIPQYNLLSLPSINKFKKHSFSIALKQKSLARPAGIRLVWWGAIASVIFIIFFTNDLHVRVLSKLRFFQVFLAKF